MDANDTELWRAEVTWTTTRDDGSYFTTEFVFGPYRTRGAAKAAISREEREQREAPPWRGRTLTRKKIQRGTIRWEDE